MLPKRAHETQPGPWSPPAEPSRATPRLADGDPAAQSPALKLRDELAARLERLTAPEVMTAVIAQPAAPKLPMAARLAVIVGLGLACWAAIGLTVLALL